jgi:5'-deoxynucleotidase YfbR-like HD superfamily hydrolase
MNDTTIRLISGEAFDYLDPSAGVIEPHDIGHALARTSRFGGHHRMPHYSVAHHTIFTAFLVAVHYRTPHLAFAALHHDDVEAFTGDWTSPMKVACRELGLDYTTKLERPIEAAVCQQLGLVLDDLHAGVVKDADRLAYIVESSVMKPGFDPGDQGFDEVDGETIRKLACWLPDYADAPTAERNWGRMHNLLGDTHVTIDWTNAQAEFDEFDPDGEDEDGWSFGE